jgi:hypothetical protein
VTDGLDHQVRLALQRQRRSPIVAIAAVVFAVIASGAAPHQRQTKIIVALPYSLAL